MFNYNIINVLLMTFSENTTENFKMINLIVAFNICFNVVYRFPETLWQFHFYSWFSRRNSEQSKYSTLLDFNVLFLSTSTHIFIHAFPLCISKRLTTTFLFHRLLLSIKLCVARSDRIKRRSLYFMLSYTWKWHVCSATIGARHT
jgi:hypothetical protein